jgi:hypothetical protein
MTLTNILPSLRRSIADPLDPDVWPEHSTPTPTDVVVAGVSLCRVAAVCETPCVHTAAASVRGGHGRASRVAESAAIVVRVVTVTMDADTGTLRIDVDAALGLVPAVLSEARLIGRASTAYSAPVTINGLSCSASAPGHPLGALLPTDLAVGDLVAIPCSAPLSVHALRSHAES